MTTTENSNGKKYLIVFICMIIQAIPFGVAQNIQPLFVPYVINEFNFTLASFSLIFTFGAIASAVFSPFLGKLFSKINIKILFIVGTVLSSLGFLGFGFAKTLPQFYILSAISQIGCVLFSGLGVPYVINNWFPKKGRGKALGLAFSGGSIGNIFLQQITSHMLASKGSSYSYVFFGLLSMIVSLPIILLVIRTPKPGELVEDIEVQENNSEKQTKTSQVVFEGLGAKLTTRNKFFWIFSVGYGIIAIAISAMSTQYATYFTNDLHLSASLIGSLGSEFAIFCLIGNVVGGLLFDKIGTFKTMSIAGFLAIISPISLLIAHNVPSVAFVFSIAYGLNVYSYTLAPAFMVTDVFGKKESSVILGIVSLLFAVGFALGSTLFGLITDNFGFQVAWISMLACVIVGYILLLTSITVIKNQNKKSILQ